MTRFFIGEQVIIRYGRRQGKKAIIMQTQAADAFMVKVEDGPVLFYSSKGLEKTKEEPHQLV